MIPILVAAAVMAPQLWYRQPAKSWSEALPVGNGRLAAMVYGQPDREHLQLNEETLYAGAAMDRTNPEARAAIPEIRRLLLQNKPAEAEKLAARAMLAIPQRQPPYQPVGDLTVDFRTSADEVGHYRRAVDLYSGEATVEFQRRQTAYKRTIFASYPDNVIALHLEAKGTDKLTFTVALTREKDARSSVEAGGVLLLRGQPLPPQAGRGYPGEPQTGARFTAAVRILADGPVTAHGSSLEVRNASQAAILLSAATDVETSDPDAECRKRLDDALRLGYEQLRGRHERDFRALAERVHLTLGDSDRQIAETATDELLSKAAAGGGDDRALTALYFAYGRYLLQSSSRETTLPANLQGKWNESLDPSWGSKYTININTEMNYWPAEVANLPETAESMHQLFARLGENGRRTAKEMYGTGGLVAHHNTEVWGDTQPIDGVPYGVWPFGAAWLSLSLWDHYDYNRDRRYLRERAYPIMRDCAQFLLENLFEDGAGHLVSGPSLSPENRYVTDDGTSASLDVSPTMDVELTRALFDRVREAAKILGIDAEFCRKLEAAEARLIPLQVGRYGQLQEWRRDYSEKEPGHRHLSHLFAVYPSSEINRETPELWKAARVSLERRLASGGGGTGWSRAWVVCLWATFGEGDKADESLRVLYERSTWPNLFDLHPPHIFQIDGNLGATAGIAEMLISSRGTNIKLLPALPRSWPDGSIKGLRVRGNAVADLEWSGGKVSRFTLQSPTGGKWNVIAPDGRSQVIQLQPSESRTVSVP